MKFTLNVIKFAAIDALIASLAFYLISNLLVFWFSGLYSKTFVEFFSCYFCALPFFINKLTLYCFVLSAAARAFFVKINNRL